MSYIKNSKWLLSNITTIYKLIANWIWCLFL